jgi:hypothetical protein
MSLRIAVGAAALVGALVYGPTASASTLTATYTGVVADGMDFIGTFGTANTDLTGQSFVARFTYDTSLGQLDAGQESDLFGGVGHLEFSPVLMASVTIGGVTVSLPNVDEGQISIRPGEIINPTLTTNDVGEQASEVFPEPNGVTFDSISLQMLGRAIDMPTTFDGLYSGPVISGFGQLSFSSETFGFTTPPSIFDLTPETLTIGAAGIPEPATWALMILGFGALGAVQRRARNTRALV